ncbi:MAG TPA: hypothetical protein DEP00_01775 [Lachnospiraceae bacterium]|nr:hypothetical protein [Lachnospiraceae bacterium]
MKKIIALALAAAMVLSLTACSSSSNESSTTESSTAESSAVESSAAESSAATEASTAADGSVMTHEQFIAADVDSEVTVETYVQAKQSWWEDNGQGKATFYTQAEDGAYFLYEMPCTEDEYNQLVPGTKIKVTGYKSEWPGEIEITDATFEIEDGTWTAEPTDVTDLLGTDQLQDHMNELVSFKGMTVEASKDPDGKDVAYLYNYDGSGSEGDDLYFNVSYNGQTYSFTVESYLCDKDSDVYKAVENLKIGDTVDMEGFLYWYEGANPHITSVTVK